MDMKELERTEELLCKSLKEINEKGELNNISLDLIGKTIDAIKDIHMITAEPNKSYGAYEGHHGGQWTAEGSYGRMTPEYRWTYGSRDGDGDGRYNESRYNGMNGYGNYGDSHREYGRMYGHNEDMVDQLRHDMQNAKSESEREYIRKMLRKYDN